MKYYFLFFMLLVLNSCQLMESNDTDAIDKSLKKWGEAYFNYNYTEALDYMTPESEKWIRFAASNITQQDIDFINENPRNTTIEIIDRNVMAGDTTCAARIRVTDFVQLGFVGQENKTVQEAVYQVMMAKRSGKWLVRMEGQPQSEK